MNVKTFLHLFALAFVVIAIPLRADDEPDRGRLPDGRAFRTDAEGMQLVDYVAELELSVEELNTKVHGLESEVEEKQAIVDRCSRGGPVEPKLAERDLLGGANKATGSVPVAFDQSQCPEQQSCPVCAACPICPVMGSTSQTLKCPPHERILDLSACPVANCGQSTGRLEAQVKEINDQITRERQVHESEIAALRNLARQQEAVLEQKNQEIQVVRARLDDSARSGQETLSTLELQLRKSQEEASRKAEETARVAKQLEETRATVQTLQTETSLSDRRASLGIARDQAVGAVRASVQSEYNRLRGLIQTRDRKYNEYKRLPAKSLDFKPSPLASSRNVTMEMIADQINRASAVHELNALQRDLREIKNKVNDDIALITRMSKRV